MWPIQDSNLEVQWGKDGGEICRFLGQPDTLTWGFTQGMHFPGGFSLGMEGKRRKLQLVARASRKSTGRSWITKSSLLWMPVWSANPIWRATLKVVSGTAGGCWHHLFPRGISTLEVLWFSDFILIFHRYISKLNKYSQVPYRISLNFLCWKKICLENLLTKSLLCELWIYT